MTKAGAIAFYKEIQNGRGTGDLWDAYKAKFGVGRVAEYAMRNEHVPFQFGIEYGILIALALAFELMPEDVYWNDSPTNKGGSHETDV